MDFNEDEIKRETDAILNDPKTWASPEYSSSKMTSINFDAKLWILAKENQIPLKDALEFGIKFLIADKNEFDYPECNLQKKVSTLGKKLSLKSQECESLRDQMEIKEK